MDDDRKPQPKEKSFNVIFRYGEDEYLVTALDIEAAIARKAFRLDKQSGDKQTYEVQVTAAGPQCGCKGFLYRGRCKHVFMLTKARMLD